MTNIVNEADEASNGGSALNDELGCRRQIFVKELHSFQLSIEHAINQHHLTAEEVYLVLNRQVKIIEAEMGIDIAIERMQSINRDA